MMKAENLNMFTPKNASGKLPAIAVSGPFGAVKEQSSGLYAHAGGVVDPLPEDAPYFVKDYHAYYKTDRGYHARSLNSNNGWNVTAGTSLMNTRLFTYSKEIKSFFEEYLK